jgi:protein TonB
METTAQAASHELKSELARLCMPDAHRDANRKLAWVNSICICFLIIGIVGAKRAVISIKPPPPIEVPVPVVVEPLPPPPTRLEVQQTPEETPKSEAPQVVVATIDTPAINFSIPTVANLVVPNAVAVAPPSNPSKPITQTLNQPTGIGNTGSGGERPAPPSDYYPPLAIQMRQEGTTVLLMTAAENGTIKEVSVQQSSGSRILDHASVEWVKAHWLLPSGAAGRAFVAPIKWILSNN